MRIFILSLIILTVPFASFSLTPAELDIADIVIVEPEDREVVDEETTREIRPDVIAPVQGREAETLRPAPQTRDAASLLQRERVVNFEEVREQRVFEAQERAREAQISGEEIRVQRMAEAADRQEEFRNKLEEIRSEQLRERARRLSENINRVNYNLSSRHNGLISAMEIILDKLESRTAKIEEATERDLSSVYAKIDQARLVIEETREEIVVQKGKVYVVEITSEETLGEDFQRTIQEMRSDHEVLKTKIQNTLRESIREVIAELRNLTE